MATKKRTLSVQVEPNYSNVAKAYVDTRQQSLLLAEAFISIVCPIQDEISEREAISCYGGEWLKRYREAGIIKPRRVGNKKIYSRHDLDCLRQAEGTLCTLTYKGKKVIF